MSAPSDDRAPLSSALEALLARYAAKVRWVARDCRLAPDEIDELFQDVRIRIWRALARGERIDGVNSSYVHRTVMSAAVDLIRSRRSRRAERVDLAGPDGEALLGASPSADRVAEDGELAAQIAAALASLSDRRRAVVRMYLAGYHIEEIATRLDWTEPTTRNLLYRGLAELRLRLREKGIGREGEL